MGGASGGFSKRFLEASALRRRLQFHRVKRNGYRLKLRTRSSILRAQAATGQEDYTLFKKLHVDRIKMGRRRLRVVAVESELISS